MKELFQKIFFSLAILSLKFLNFVLEKSLQKNDLKINQGYSNKFKKSFTLKQHNKMLLGLSVIHGILLVRN